jgi:hypothetical protein
MSTARAIAYLVVHEWTGVSEDATKVWVLTEARESLQLQAPDRPSR